jgi:hypothetical protein
MNLNLSSIAKIVDKNEDIFIDYHQKGILIWEKSGYHKKHLPPEVSEVLAQQEIDAFYNDVDKYFNELSNAPDRLPEQLHITVYIKIDDTQTIFSNNILYSFLKKMSEKQIVQTIFCFQKPSLDWKFALTSFFSNLSERIQSGTLHITLCGTFRKTSIEDMEFLLEHNVRLQHVIQNSKDFAFDRDVLFHHADFGFRIPAIWYVHADNIDDISFERIDDTMFSNYNSGFGVPLVSNNIFYQTSNFSLPDASQYLKLLSDIYKKYPYYDDVLFPLSSMAILCYSNGYSRFLNITRNIQLLIDNDEDISFLGHTPFWSVHWLSWKELNSIHEDVFTKMLCDYAELQKRCRLKKCQQCQWKYICGGEYSMTPNKIEPLNIICRQHDFFFKIFLWQRHQVITQLQMYNETSGNK